MTDRHLIVRLLIIALAVIAAWTGLGFRLASLHLGPNDRLLSKVRNLHYKKYDLLVGRGEILDCNGLNLAVDLPVLDVCVNPEEIQRRGLEQVVGSRLAYILNVELAAVMDRITRQGRKCEFIKRHVQRATVDRIESLQLPGVWADESPFRYYPHESSLCHVIGFSNFDGVGSAGVEQEMDRYLKGRPGMRETEKDGRKSEVYNRRSIEIPAREGGNVYLTIDMTLQYLVEKALERAMAEHSAKGAWAVVQHVKSGRILALASAPAYDLNQYGKMSESVKLNRAVGYTYEPGSTMKALVFAAAFNEGIVSEEEEIDCEKSGVWFYRGRPLKDFHAYGPLSVANVLKKSSNIGTAKIALRLGEARLEEYLRDFGIGAATGIDLPGEEHGLFAPRSRWSSLSISRIPMGHEVAVTALQMAAAYSAIANDGFLMKPLIVDRVVNPKGDITWKSEPEVVARPITEQTSRTLRRLLLRVTEDDGTARRARVEGYEVAAKTGTAEKVVNGQYDRDANIASMVGFLPARFPELTIIVVVDEPQPIHTGGRVAGPVFKEIAEQAVRYLAIPPGGAENVFPVATMNPMMN